VKIAVLAPMPKASAARAMSEDAAVVGRILCPGVPYLSANHAPDPQPGASIVPIACPAATIRPDRLPIVPLNETSPLTTDGGTETAIGVDEPQVMLRSALF
jgi:hypothetical protein